MVDEIKPQKPFVVRTAKDFALFYDKPTNCYWFGEKKEAKK